MYSKYLVLIDKNNKLPDRVSLVEKAWGDLPVSHIQDAEDLNEASYLDLKVNKWEVNGKWSTKQNQEPWIRIEILRGESLLRFVNQNDFGFPVDQSDSFLMTFELDELDEGWLDVDYALIANLVRVLPAAQKIFAYDESYIRIDGYKHFETVPTKDLVKEKLINI